MESACRRRGGRRARVCGVPRSAHRVVLSVVLPVCERQAYQLRITFTNNTSTTFVITGTSLTATLRAITFPPGQTATSPRGLQHRRSSSRTPTTPLRLNSRSSTTCEIAPTQWWRATRSSPEPLHSRNAMCARHKRLTPSGCWVTADEHGRVPALLLEWRQTPDGWQGRVVRPGLDIAHHDGATSPKSRTAMCLNAPGSRHRSPGSLLPGDCNDGPTAARLGVSPNWAIHASGRGLSRLQGLACLDPDISVMPPPRVRDGVSGGWEGSSTPNPPTPPPGWAGSTRRRCSSTGARKPMAGRPVLDDTGEWRPRAEWLPAAQNTPGLNSPVRARDALCLVS